MTTATNPGLSAYIKAYDVLKTARRIKMPLDDWPGNCSAVCESMLQHNVVKGRLAYGHWRGPISPTSTFASRREIGFTHHAWIILRDGTICDPTRWVFLVVPPEIHFGPAVENGELIYDEGGTIYKEELGLLNRPTRCNGKRVSLDGLGWALRDVLSELLGKRIMPVTLDLGHIIWLANLPPKHFETNLRARQFYAWLQKRRLLAWVPIDFRYMTGFEKREVGD